MKERLLITGVSGLLGSNVAFALKDRFSVAGVYHEHAVKLEGGETFQADLRDASEVKVLITKTNPDYVLHCAALADIDSCEKYPVSARMVNVLATSNLVEALKGSSVQFIYVSTDQVYSGEKSLCREDDSLFPRNEYSRTKLAGEREALKRLGSLVLRTNFFGWTVFNQRRSLAEWFIGELEAGRPVRGFSNAFFSSIYTMDFAVLLEGLINQNAAGIFNLGSREGSSKYEFLMSLAGGLNLNTKLISAVSVDEIQGRVARSKNLVLDVSRLQSIIGNVPFMKESVNHFIKDYREGVGEKLRRTVNGV